MPESQERMLRRPYHKDRFTYDEESDSYLLESNVVHQPGIPNGEV